MEYLCIHMYVHILRIGTHIERKAHTSRTLIRFY